MALIICKLNILKINDFYVPSWWMKSMMKDGPWSAFCVNAIYCNYAKRKRGRTFQLTVVSEMKWRGEHMCLMDDVCFMSACPCTKAWAYSLVGVCRRIRYTEYQFFCTFISASIFLESHPKLVHTAVIVIYTVTYTLLTENIA